MDKMNRNNWWIYVLALFGATAIGCIVTYVLGGEFNINKYFKSLWLCGVVFLIGILIGYRKNKRKKQ
jgi:uncharacterized membrane protein YhaH (DUF805 family)